MKNYKTIKERVDLDFFQPVQSKKTKQYQVICPFEDGDGNYRTSYWCESLEQAKQSLGKACGYVPKHLKEESKNWRILTPFKLKPKKTLEVGQEVEILKSVEEANDWENIKDKYPDRKGVIARILNGREGLRYAVGGNNFYNWLSADYIVPVYPQQEKPKTMEERVAKLEKKVFGEEK